MFQYLRMWYIHLPLCFKGLKWSEAVAATPAQQAVQVWENHKHQQIIAYFSSAMKPPLQRNTRDCRLPQNVIILVNTKYNMAVQASVLTLLQVHLPRNQLFVMRVSPRALLSDILYLTCTEKNLDPNKYELRHPGKQMDCCQTWAIIVVKYQRDD